MSCTNEYDLHYELIKTEAVGSVQKLLCIGNCWTKISIVFCRLFGIFCSISEFFFIYSIHKVFIVQKNILRTMLGIGPRCSCKGWFVKLNIVVSFWYIFSLIMFVFNNLDNFKANSLHDFDTGSKNQLHFSSVKPTSF